MSSNSNCFNNSPQGNVSDAGMNAQANQEGAPCHSSPRRFFGSSPSSPLQGPSQEMSLVDLVAFSMSQQPRREPRPLPRLSTRSQAAGAGELSLLVAALDEALEINGGR